jgi:hypothetical protein
MRAVRFSTLLIVGVLVAGVLVGCAGSAQPTAAGSRAPGSPTASPVPTPASSPSATYSPPTAPAPPPQPEALTCGRIPVEGDLYWQEKAVPPATCQQAESVLPTAVANIRRPDNPTVKGWSCRFDLKFPNGGPQQEVTCTKGSLTVYAVDAAYPAKT